MVNGNIRLSGSGSALIFADGSILTSSSSISVGAISNTSDAVIYADSDKNGYGSIVMKTNNITAAVINNAGKMGIGSLNPQEKLHIIGDVMIGNTLNPFSNNSQSDLIVEGNIVVDGYLKQRSSIPAEFESLYVRGNVFLSTGTDSKTGIGTLSPQEKLDVNGNINLSGSFKINGIEVITSARALTNLTGISSAGTINFQSLSPSRLVATDGSRNLISSISAENLRNSVSGTTGSGDLVFNTQPTFTTGITVNGRGNFTQGITASSGTFTQTGDYSILSSSGIKVSNGVVTINSLSSSRLVATDGSKNLTSSISAANLQASVSGTTGSGDLVFSTTPTFNTGIIVSGWGNFTQGITASSGTFTQTGDYSIITSSGIKISNGIITINSLTPSRLVATDGSRNLISSISAENLRNSVSGTTGSGSLVFNDQPSFTTGITVNGWGNFTQGITASSGTFTTGIGTPLINLANNVYISSTTSANGGGVYISTHIYLVSGGRFYGDGSQIININATNITSGVLPALRGGTGISGAGGTANRALITTDGSTWTAGQINPATMISAGTLPTNVVASSITTNTVYTDAIQNGAVTDAKISSVNATKITGTLPIATGGTNNNSFTQNQPIIYDGTKLASFSGFNGSFTVAKSTNPSQGCIQLNFQYGVLVSTSSVSCQ